MKKIYLLFIAVCIIGSAYAQKSVVYATTLRSDLAEGAWAENNDVIIQMLKNDASFTVTTVVLEEGGIDPGTAAAVDLSGYDLIVLHDGLSSGDAFWTPSGSAAIASLPAPTIYSKMYALRKEKAFTTSSGVSVNAEGVYELTVVDQSNDLFKGIDVSSGAFTAMKGGVTDAGATGDRGLQYNQSNTISAENTLLAYPSGATDPVISFSDLPAGTTVDDATLANRVMVMGYNCGVPRCTEYQGRTAFTAEGLTLVRNAAYILTGMSVPTDLVDMSFLTSAKKLAKAKLNVYGVAGGIKLPENSNASIYSVSGKLMKQGVNEKFVPASKGMYIVRSGNLSAKVMVIE